MKVLISDKISESAISLFKDKKVDFTYSPEIIPEELVTVIPQYDVLIVRSRTKARGPVLDAGKNLKIIGRVGTGVDNIDVAVCKQRNIIVVNAPDANSQSVAELTIALMLSMLRKLDKAYISMKNGLWLKKELGGGELNGKTVGILGFGHIGRKVKEMVEVFGAKAIVWSKSQQTMPLDEFLGKADILTLHLSLNDNTHNLINREKLTRMKPESFLVNTSRGEIIEEDALYDTLKKGKIKGAALDVFWQEPMPIDSRWRKLDNVILTPHLGASTKEALKRASITVANDIIRFISGEEPQNII